MLFKKMFRDIMSHKTQFSSIILMSLLGTLIYSGFSSEANGLDETSKNYYNQTNLADFWVYGKEFSQDQVNNLLDNKEIEKVTRRFSYNANVDLKKSPTLKLNYVDNTDVSKVYLIDGEKFSTDKDGIWLDASFAKEHNLKVGDSLTISIESFTIKEKIKGLVLHPEYVFSTKDETEMIPNHKSYGFAYLSYKEFPKDIPLTFNELLISTTTNEQKKIESILDKKLKYNYSVLLSRDNNVSYSTFDSEIKQHKSMGSIFPVIFLAIAMLTILTTMTRLISNQRTEIGTLKALGFKKRKILTHYISYGFFVSLIGSIIGTILGPMIIPSLCYTSIKEMYVLNEWKPSISISIIIVSIITVLLSTLITYTTCAKSLKENPAKILRPKAPKQIKQLALEKTRLWNKLGFNLQWNLRDIFRSKTRSLMAIIGVMGCTTLLLTALGLLDSMNDMFSWQYNDLYKYQSKLLLNDNITQTQIDKLIDTYNGSAIQESSVEIKHDDIVKSTSLTVTDDNKLIKYQDKKRNYITKDNSKIAISQKLAEILNVEAGDKIVWHIFGDDTWHTDIIGTVYSTPIAQGITLSKQYYENLNYKMEPTSIITNEYINKDNLTGVKKISTTSELMENAKTVMDTSMIMVYALITLAVLLALVVLYNLGILSFTEKIREYSTLKVLGFKSKKIRNLLITQNIILTIVAILIGIPSGYYLLKYLSTTLSDNLLMHVIISPQSLLISLLGTFIVSILVNFMFSKKIKTIDMVSSLKGVE